MKVAYILHDTDVYGGAYKSLLPMLRALIKKGVEPLVVMPVDKYLHTDRNLKKDLDAMNIPTLVLKYRPNTYPYEYCLKDYMLWIPRLLARRYVNAKATKHLAEYIKGYDIVHSNTSTIDIGARAAKIVRIPHVYHFREYADKDFGMRYYPSRGIFYKTVTNSICITKDIQAYHHLIAHSEVIYDCILNPEEIQNISHTGERNQSSYILFVGRLEYAKGIEELIDAYSESTRLLPLLVAGAPLESSYLENLKNHVAGLGMEKAVQFLGQRDDVLHLMANARVTVVPSYSEGFGRILPEAMFMHCLTIGRNTSGTKEQYDNGVRVTGGEIGLRFNTKEEMTELLNQVFSAPHEQWREYIDRAYRTVNMLYTPEACSEAVMKFYKKILNS